MVKKSIDTAMPEGTRTAEFAGGCFWCTESDNEKMDGVIKTTSGYAGEQFVDRGNQYRNAIFDRPVVTDILLLWWFYPAKDYHQDYLKKNPFRHKWYPSGFRRDQFLEKQGDGQYAKLFK